MLVYGSPVSPFVRKVMVYGEERGLNLELIGIRLGDPNPDFGAISPFRKMPALKDGDFGIADSSAIITYLETKYPDGGLLPVAAESRARCIWFDEFADTMLMPASGKIFFNRFVKPMFAGQECDESVVQEGVAELPRLFEYLENIIPASGYLVDDIFTISDISICATIANIQYCGFGPDSATYPKTSAYIAAIQTRPSFVKWMAKDAKILKLV